jgi:hypothetical protein
MASGLIQGDQYIKSEEPAENTYGRNGALSPSSDTKIGTTSTNFLPKAKAAIDSGQTRTVDASPIKTHPQMRGASPGPKLGANPRPSWK